MKKYFLIALCILLPLVSHGATYYVEAKGNSTLDLADSGATAWSNAQSISSPCSAATAMARAIADDIVYFRGGTYQVGQSSGMVSQLQPSNSGTSGHPITFIAYTGETPIINATTSGGNDNSYCIGTGIRNYITLNGFTVQSDNGTKMGSVLVYGNADDDQSTSCQVLNFTINGGSTAIPTHDNRDCLRIEHAGNVTVSHCTIYNVNHTSNDYEDNSGIKFYHAWNCIIENCEFYNMATGGTAINAKSDADGLIIRNNYIHGAYRAIYGDAGALVMENDNVIIYNNVIANCGWCGINFDTNGTDYHDRDFIVYNNTIYNCVRGICLAACESGDGPTVYNNIVVGNAYDLWLNDQGNPKAADHNQWGDGSLSLYMRYGNSGTQYTSLSTWRVSNELETSISWGYDAGGCTLNQHPGCGDRQDAEADIFVAATGDRDILTEFTLKADGTCIGAGRSSNIGADVSLVGPDAGATPALQPTPPTLSNVTISNGRVQ